MIPVRDVVPSRTAPGVTVSLIAAMLAALSWPGVREWWLLWAAHVVVLWLFGGTVEDRLGHGRFAGFCVVCLAAAVVVPPAIGRVVSLHWVVGGGVAGLSAAYFLMFPGSRVLTLVPAAAGVDIVDVPAWTVWGLWAIVQAAAVWSSTVWAEPADPVAAAASMFAGGLAGALGWLVLRRPERMGVDWWDSAGR
jgi:membrane associated rhomboid family serine protease